MGSSLKCSCSAKRCGTLGQLSRSSFDSVVMGWVSVALLLDRIEGGGTWVPPVCSVSPRYVVLLLRRMPPEGFLLANTFASVVDKESWVRRPNQNVR